MPAASRDRIGVEPEAAEGGDDAGRTAARLILQLRTAAGQADPWPVYTRLRATGPIIPTVWGGLLVTPYQECDQVLRSRYFEVPDRDWRARQGGARWTAYSSRQLARTLLALPAAEHSITRQSLGKVFDHGWLVEFQAWLSARTAQLLDGYIDRLRDGKTADFVEMVSEELPIAAVGHWLHLPVVDLPRLRTLIHAQTAAQELLPVPGDLAAADAAMVELHDYVAALVDSRRSAPGSDAVSGWIAVWDRLVKSRAAVDQAVHSLTLLMLLAAVETTASLLATLSMLIAQYPAQRAWLAAHRDWIPAAVEEALRCDPPVHVISRVAVEDTMLAGCHIKEGQLVHVMVGAAHRDPSRHLSPHRFDIRRVDQGHLAFSRGRHFCLGAPMARMEAQTLLSGLLSRPALLQSQPAEHADGVVFRRILRLPMSLI